MGLRLKRIDNDDTRPALERVRLVYSVAHSNGRTTLDLDAEVRVSYTSAVASMTIETPECEDEEKALDKLAEWLDRMATALRDRTGKDVRSVRLYGAPATKEPTS